MQKKKYKPYPEYKDSGVEWLGKVPADWELKKLKYIASVMPSNVDKKTKKGEKDISLCNYTDVYYNDLIESSLDFMKASATAEQISKFVLESGDTIITKDSEDPNDIAIATFVSENLSDVICGYHLALIKPFNRHNGAYLKRFFESGYSRSYFSTRANGLTRYGLGTYSIQNVNFLQPSSPEQTQIAAFLDHETAKIDKLIEKQKKLIELLKEKRQAVISHAVTKGLNPDAPMKDSGVEWLGEVPAHWKVKRIKHLAFTISKGTTPSTVGGEFIDSGIRFLKAENIGKSAYVSEEPTFFISKDVDGLISRSRLKENDVLVIIAGATTGAASIMQSDFLPTNINQAVSFIRPRVFQYSKLIFNWLLTDFTKRIIKEGAVQSAQPNLSMEDLGNIPIIVPPKIELENITKYIDKQTNKLDYLVMNAMNVISLLQERRTALISAAVTGKFDVRDWKAPESVIAENNMPDKEACLT
ncbi:MAG: restriction endonuclease subunit S [Spirochaetales bacterium]|nr:restriction endonuclease subunit S [Spirochaetales bacterium]